MSDQICMYCGKKITTFNKSQEKNVCTKCYTYGQDLKYFEKNSVDEEDIHQRDITAKLGIAIAYSLAIVVGWYLGIGILRIGIFGGFIVAFVVVLLLRKPMQSSLTHPLDRRRFNNYFLAQYIPFFLFEIYLPLYLMNLLAMGKFDHPIVAWNPYLVEITVILISVVIGLIGLFVFDKKAKQKTLDSYRRWRDEKATE